MSLLPRPESYQDEILRRELYFLILKFLEGSPLQDTYKIFLNEIQRKQLLPPQYNWIDGEELPQDQPPIQQLCLTGPSTSTSSSSSSLISTTCSSSSNTECDRTTTNHLEQLLLTNRHIGSDHLLLALKRLHETLLEVNPPSIKPAISFLSPGRFSLVQPYIKPYPHDELYYIDHNNSIQPRSLELWKPKSIRHKLILMPKRHESYKYAGHIYETLFSRQLCGPRPITQFFSPSLFRGFNKHKRVLGHLSCCFCLTFDRTGRFFISGADDGLIKIWCASSGRLLASLRGHQGEISDLSVSMENDILASSSCDKTIRIWNLRSTALMTTLRAHTNQVHGVRFAPLMTNDNRYLVSISRDASVIFHRYNVKTKTFLADPIKFDNRKRRNSEIVSYSFSAGGSFLACGSTDSSVYVYHLDPVCPVKILEIEQHNDYVDSLQFSYRSFMKFVSGSRDGSAFLWNYRKQSWHNQAINIYDLMPNQKPPREGSKNDLRVGMVAWTIDDSYVVISLNDFSIKVWSSYNAKLKQVLLGHQDEVFILEPHPVDSRIILSAGHDGCIIIWDVITGANLIQFNNQVSANTCAAFFDAKWNPDGTMFVATDSHGHISFFSLNQNNPYGDLPVHMFFHTDYRPLVSDQNGYVLDEQSQLAPHLMPPPFLVDIDGNPYPPHLQRLVPGRERYSHAELVPYADMENIVRQPTIQDRIDELSANIPVNNQQQQNVEQNNENDQQQQRQEEDNQPRLMRNDWVRPRLDNVIPQRNINQEATLKCVIPPLSVDEIEKITERQNSITNAEEEYYNSEKSKLPTEHDKCLIHQAPVRPQDKPFTRRQKRLFQQRRGVTHTANGEQSSTLQEFLEQISERISDDENDEDFTGTSEESSSDEDESTSDSDWNQPSTSMETHTHHTTTQRIRRCKRRRSDSSNANDVDEDEDQINNEPEASATNHTNEDEDDNNNNEATSTRSERPTSSSSRRPRRMEVEEREKLREDRIKRLQEMRMNRINRQVRQMDRFDERFRPPDWLTDSKPKRTPYFPQIGDKVVYFRKGHQKYLDVVRQLRCYKLLPLVKPFKLRDSEAEEIFAKIIDIQYQVKPPRLVTLKMLVIDPQAEDNSIEQPQPDGQLSSSSSLSPFTRDKQFSVRYHDLDHVCDFIVLKQLYDASISHDWRTNDLFKSVIDDKWWIGRIDSIRYEQENTYFQSIQVKWNSGEKELLSPWDLEPLTEEQKESLSNHREGIPITDEERATFSSIDEQEWPSEIRERDSQRLINGLIRIMQYAYAEDFSVPVDLNVHPIYAMIVPYPMDLSTILARLQNNFYRRLEAVKFDMKFIESNAVLYNVSESEIVKKAKIITECCLRFIDNPDCEDPTPIYNEVNNAISNSTTTTSAAVSQENDPGVSSILPRRSTRTRRPMFFDSDQDDDYNHNSHHSYHRHHQQHAPHSLRIRHQRSSLMADDAQQEQSTTKSWKQLCRELVDFMFNQPDSHPFRAPIDPITYPNYSYFSSTPMDLTTVKEQLLADVYNSPADFAKDMRLIFSNSKSYNTNKKSRIYSITIRLSNLFEERMRKIMYLLKTSKKTRRGGGDILSSYSSSTRGHSRRGRQSRLMSPVSNEDEDNEAMNGHLPMDQPSTSSAVLINNSRSAATRRRLAAINFRSARSESIGKYGLRHRAKRIRTYKEESDDDNYDVRTGRLHRRASNSTIVTNTEQAHHFRNLRTNRKRKTYGSDFESFDDEEDENEDEDTDKTEEDSETQSEEASEQEKDDQDEHDEEDEIMEEEHDGDILNDSDATQVDDENNEDSNGRPIRTVAKNRVNYNENDQSDEDEEDSPKRKNKSQESSSTTATTTNTNNNQCANYIGFKPESDSNTEEEMNCDNHDDNTIASDGLRRSRRKIRKRRFSSDEDEDDDNDDEDFDHRNRARSKHIKARRSYNNKYDNSNSDADLYSSVKTRQRSGSTSGGSSTANIIQEQQQHNRPPSSRNIQRINYNEDELDRRLFSSVISSPTSTRTATVFTNGPGTNRHALVSR